jgi:hypothetical protein
MARGSVSYLKHITLSILEQAATSMTLFTELYDRLQFPNLKTLNIEAGEPWNLNLPPRPQEADLSWLLHLLDFSSTSKCARLDFNSKEGTEAGPLLNLPKVQDLTIGSLVDLKWVSAPSVRYLCLPDSTFRHIPRIDGEAASPSEFPFGQLKTIALDDFVFFHRSTPGYHPHDLPDLGDVMCIAPNLATIILTDPRITPVVTDGKDSPLFLPICTKGMEKLCIKQVPEISLEFAVVDILDVASFQQIVLATGRFVRELQEIGCPTRALRFSVPRSASKQLAWLRSTTELPNFKVKCYNEL